MADDDRSGPPTTHDVAVINNLVRAFARLRRAMVRPATAVLPFPSIGRQVDFAKVLACHAVAESAESTESATHGLPTVKDVATALELEHSTASRILGEAEAEGLVTRGTDTADRRRTTVVLTDLGRALVSESNQMQNYVLDQTLAQWEPNDVRTLARLIERLAVSLHAELPTVLQECQVDLAHGRPVGSERRRKAL